VRNGDKLVGRTGRRSFEAFGEKKRKKRVQSGKPKRQ